jgi:hypothetical protein
MRVISATLWAGIFFLLSGCADNSAVPVPSSNRSSYSLGANASGILETVNNIANLTVVSQDVNDLKAEYRAGFVQGKLQEGRILAARDNTWDNAYLTKPLHTFPKQHGPTRAELDRSGSVLLSNYAATLLIS